MSQKQQSYSAPVRDKDTEALVQKRLEALGKPRSIDALKQLFWSDLEYTRAVSPLPYHSWPDTTRQYIDGTDKDGPILLFATGGHDNGFHIIYIHLASPTLSLSQEREIVTRLLKDHQDALFVFSNLPQDTWHFLNIKTDDKQSSRLIFRRITVGPRERLRTASERLAMLSLAGRERSSSLDIRGLHEKAFDVEAVTKRFFESYRSVFQRVEQDIQGFSDTERRRLFAQRLFNRLMFIAFIQKKGWLAFDGHTDYLNALWHDYRRRAQPDSNFYLERLSLLFFTGLNTDNEVNVIDIARKGFLNSLIGNPPYLNGGLFEESEEDKNPSLFVPDASIQAVLEGLFDRFNFTVTESTPLDVEVAVDPEMLGKVFEELVTGRHETGSYYTPKPVVSFMCREALKGYLHAKLPQESEQALARFVDEHNPQELRDPEAILDALRKVRVCDPACGSGAYLLGMLHELLDLRACLFATRKLDAISIYQRKLEIIQNNVYGVDLDPFAVNIARLRLWLSLEVDFEGDRPQPLPNLDFKIESGDSLLAPDPQGAQNPAFRDALVEQFREKKEAYIKAHHGEKQTLRQEINEIREGIAKWTHTNGNVVTGFDWAVEFAEVFMNGGFDIIVANPPYVRADTQFKHLKDEEDSRQEAIAEWKEWRKLLLKRNIYRTLYEKWDLYIPFLERAYQLLRVGGQMVFIIPDAYNAAKYAQRSQDFFLENAYIKRIDFCSDIFLFAAGVNNTILHFAKTRPITSDIPLRVRRWGENADDFNANIEFLPSLSQQEFGRALFKLNNTQVGGFSDSQTLMLGQICYISVGMVINADEDGHIGEFTVNDLLAEKKDMEHPKRFVLGKDVMKWRLRKVRYLEWGTGRAPSRFRRQTFEQFQEAKVKLLSVRTPGETPKVTYDDDQIHFDASSVGFVQWGLLKGVRNKSIQKSAKYKDELKEGESFTAIAREDLEKFSQEFLPEYLLGIMNSTFAKEWLTTIRRSKRHIYPDDWKSMPIVIATEAEQAAIAALVQKCLDAQGVGCEAWEREIDERIAALYGL